MNGLGDVIVSIVFLIGVLVLVGSELLSHRMTISKAVKLVLVWVVIFAAAYVVIGWLTPNEPAITAEGDLVET